MKFFNIPHKFSPRMEQRSHHILWPKHRTYTEPVKKTNSGILQIFPVHEKRKKGNATFIQISRNIQLQFLFYSK